MEKRTLWLILGVVAIFVAATIIFKYTWTRRSDDDLPPLGRTALVFANPADAPVLEQR